MDRHRRILIGAAVLLIAAGAFVGTRPMARRTDRIGFRCGTHVRPRCHTYEWPAALAVDATSAGVALLVAMLACWARRARARSRRTLDSIAPETGLATKDALLVVALPLFVVGIVAGAIYFNLVVSHVPTGD
jgi:hypothetical protein